MNRVQACPTMDERTEGVAPIGGLDAPFDELAAPASGRRARSAADTLRYADADPFADTLTARAQQGDQVILLTSHVEPHVPVRDRWLLGG